MTDNQADLSYAFLESHPTDAARVLERLAPAVVAALIAEAPIRTITPVIRKMLPLASARCLLLLEDDKAVGLLRAVGAQTGVALLRQLETTHRVKLLSQLPTALSITFELLLGYPEGTVGAWMEPNTLALPKNMTVNDAIQRVREMDQTSNANPYVINANLGLVGIVELADLLRADASHTLAILVRPSPFRLPAQASLTNVLDHEGWTEHSILPVVDHADHLIGSMTYAALLKALRIDQSHPQVHGTDSFLVTAASSYWDGVSGLVQSFVNHLPVSASEKKT
ncbi:MAG: CBS domain-containing protein [Methylophilaceae bacterium]